MFIFADKHFIALKKLLILFISLLPIFSYAQDQGSSDTERKQKVYITAGPEVNLVIPTDFGTRNDGFFNDTMVRFTPNISFRFGMNIRFDFSRLLALQSGLYYINRSYTIRGGVTNTARNGFESVMFESSPLRYTGFEVPVMLLFYVQLSDRWFLNASAGFSFDFFPSSVQKRVEQDINDYYVIVGGRNSWFRPSIKASIGFEFRSEKSGYFYFGGQFHRPLLALFEAQTQRQDGQGFSKWNETVIEGGETKIFPRYTEQSITGTYFAVDVKYFFPNRTKNKFTSSRAKRR